MENSNPSLRLSRLWNNDSEGWWEICSRKGGRFWLVSILGSLGMLVGFPASRILSSLYYQDGGASQWVVAWLAVAGWPVTALALMPFYLNQNTYPTRLTFRLFLAYAVLGFMSAADNMLFSWAYDYLPASTASMISASSLPFTAIFAYFLVGKKPNISMLNAVVVIMAASVILALDSSSDRPAGVTNTQYAIGFMVDVAGSALHGLIFALSELVFIKYLGRTSTHVILEQQTMVSIFGFAFTTLGIVINGDFSNVSAESSEFLLGTSSYYTVLVFIAVTMQVGVLGSVAVMYSASSLLAGVLNAAVVPVTSIASVIFLNDSMDGFKILSLLLTGWGFAAYIYGGYREAENNIKNDLKQPLLSMAVE